MPGGRMGKPAGCSAKGPRSHLCRPARLLARTRRPPLAALAKAGLDETAQIGLSCCGISVKRQKTSVSILIFAGPWKR